MKTLLVFDGVPISIDYATQATAILARRGAGKTYLALKIAEQLLGAGQQTVLLDPVGVCYGLRSNAEGTGPGLSIPVLGGDHADLPLDPRAGVMIADLIVDHRLSMVLDLSEMSGKQMKVFVADMAEQLYRRNRQPLHLILDEADAFAPQKPIDGEQRMLGAIDKIVRRGRARGLGITMITQRPAVLHKDVLTQAETLILMRLMSPQDRAAVKLWVQAHAQAEELAEMDASLPLLAVGECWVWSPGTVFARTKVLCRDTFDSSATPKTGDARSAPMALAQIDLPALRDMLAIQEEPPAKSTSPSEQKRIVQLEKDLSDAIQRQDALETFICESAAVAGEIKEEMQKVIDLFARLHQSLDTTRAIRQSMQRLRPIIQAVKATRDLSINDKDVPPFIREHRPPGKPTRDSAHASGPLTADVKLSGPQQKVVDALAWWASVGFPMASKLQVAFIAGYTPDGGSFNNTCGSLRSLGLVSYPSGGMMALTDAGQTAARPTEARDNTLFGFHEAVFAKLNGPQKRLLQPLIDCYPDHLTVAQLAELSDYDHKGGSFNNTRGSLKTLGLAVYPSSGLVRAADVLFPEGLK